MAKRYKLLHSPSGGYFEGWRRTIIGSQPVYRSERQSQYLTPTQLQYYVTDLISKKQGAILNDCTIVTYDLIPMEKGGLNLETYRNRIEAKMIMNILKV